jgi:hypothetical protein
MRRWQQFLIGAASAAALLVFAASGLAQDTPVGGPTPKPVATDNQMLHKYVWSTVGFDGALSATLFSGLDQWKASPPEWSLDARGYTRRWVSDYAESAIGDGAKYAVAHFFHQDPSFYPCECTGFGRRLHHAVDSPFMARTPDGTRVPSAASVAGFLAGHVVSAATWYPAPLGTRDGLRHAGMSLVTKIAVDVFKEFRPRRAK